MSAFPNLDIALAHAARGRRVFPWRSTVEPGKTKPTKRPLPKHGHLDATTDEPTIIGWWKRWPSARAGWALPVGTVLVDIDDVAAFEATGLELPDAPEQRGTLTRPDGLHRLYACPDAKQGTSVVPGADTRVGGLGWAALYHVDAFAGEPPPAPSWVPREQPAPTNGHSNGHAQGALRGPSPAAGALGSGRLLIAKGSRDATLASIAGSLLERIRQEPAAGVEMALGLIAAAGGIEQPPGDELTAADFHRIAHSMTRTDAARNGAMGSTGAPEPIAYLRLPPADLEVAPPRLLSPLVCDSRTMWFGAQGVGKGALAVVAIAALADGDAAYIPGSAVAKPIRVGVLDWEDNRDEWAERLHRMQVPAESVPYREPRGPLTSAKILADVRAWADGEGVELIAVDSVIPAAGGADAMKPEAPTAYYQALRELDRPSLSLAHVPKDKADAKHPFGSTYWSTPQRLVWRVERPVDDGSRHLLRLVNTKHSRWPWSSDLFLEVGWAEPGPLRLRSALNLSLDGDPSPLIDRIVLALTVAGPLSADAIAERVGSNPDTVRRTIGRHGNRVTDDGGRPALFSPSEGSR